MNPAVREECTRMPSLILPAALPELAIARAGRGGRRVAGRIAGIGGRSYRSDFPLDGAG